MKLTLLATILLTAVVSAFPAKLKWNRNPEPDVAEYRIYQIIEGAATLRQTVPNPAAVGDGKVTSEPVEMESGQVYTVTAFNGFESEPSDPLTIPAKPTKPTGIQVVRIRVSKDLKTWQDLAYVPLIEEGTPSRFIDAQIVTLPALN